MIGYEDQSRKGRNKPEKYDDFYYDPKMFEIGGAWQPLSG
jgi:hypothetical protein